MHKTFFILVLLLLPTILVNGEDDPLIRLAQLYNQEQSPVYRIDFIIIKNLIIDDIDKEEKWPELNELILNNNLIELSEKPQLLIDKSFLNVQNPKKDDPINYRISSPTTLIPEKKKNYEKVNSPIAPRFYEKIILSSPIDPVLKKLRLSKGYRVLFESSWYQPVLKQEISYPVYIEAFDKKNKIYGELKIYKDKYLHSEIIIRFSNQTDQSVIKQDIKTRNFNEILESLYPKKKLAAQNDKYWIKTILSQIKIRFESLKKDNSNLQVIKINNDNEPIKTDLYEDLFELREERKIEENEFHYIDHPYFGVLVRISSLN